MSSIPTPLIIAGGAVAAYFLLSGNSSPLTATTSNGVTVPAAGTSLATTPGGQQVQIINGTPTLIGAPAPPTTWNSDYYKTYQYPAILAMYPEVGNPNHVLTANEAQNYYNNYVELQQWWQAEANKQFPNILAAMQYHWNHFGVAQGYSFMPFVPVKTVGEPPGTFTTPTTNSSSSGGSSTFSDILKGVGTAASIVAMFLGTNDGKLNDLDLTLLFNGAAVIKDILPMYRVDDPQLSYAIGIRLDQVLQDYI